jgi:hypothetical protein
LYFAFATYFGAAIAKMVTLDSVITPEPRLYTVLLGESADTRKSTALRVADEFFRHLGAPWTVPVLFGAGSAEGLAAELTESPDLVLHYDEFKSFVDKARAEHSVALPMVSTLFERGEYDNRIKEKKISVRGARLSLLAACTTDTYATLFDHQFHAIGFLNRLWLVADRSTASVALPAPLPLGAVEAFRQTVCTRLAALDRAYTRNGLLPVPYRLSPEARTRFTDWYQARTGTVFEKRLDTYGHRLMVLLTAMTADRLEVDAEIVTAVVALLGYQLDTRRACDPVDAETSVARMEEGIRRALARGPLPERDLKRAVHVERVGLWVFETAVTNLQRADELLVDSKSTLSGQRQKVYRLRTVPTTVTTSNGTPNPTS